MERVEIAGRLTQSPLVKHEQVPVVLKNSIEARIVIDKKELVRNANRRNKRKTKHA